MSNHKRNVEKSPGRAGSTFSTPAFSESEQDAIQFEQHSNSNDQSSPDVQTDLDMSSLMGLGQKLTVVDPDVEMTDVQDEKPQPKDATEKEPISIQTQEPVVVDKKETIVNEINTSKEDETPIFQRNRTEITNSNGKTILFSTIFVVIIAILGVYLQISKSEPTSQSIKHRFGISVLIGDEVVIENKTIILESIQTLWPNFKFQIKSESEIEQGEDVLVFVMQPKSSRIDVLLGEKKQNVMLESLKPKKLLLLYVSFSSENYQDPKELNLDQIESYNLVFSFENPELNSELCNSEDKKVGHISQFITEQKETMKKL